MTERHHYLETPFQIGLGEGRVAISLFHDKKSQVHGLIFEDTGKCHEVGSDIGFIPEDTHEPRIGEIYLACHNIESALVLQKMVNDVVDSFGEGENELQR